MGFNQQKRYIAALLACFAGLLHIMAIYSDELSTIETSHTVIGKIKARCGWKYTHSVATDFKTNYEALYANDEANIAGYLWYILTLIGLLIAIGGLVFNFWNENNNLWSHLYILSGFILIIASVCSCYGGAENVCHQEESSIGISPIFTVISAILYVAAGLTTNLKDRNYGKIPGA
eukprot:407274_1